MQPRGAGRSSARLCATFRIHALFLFKLSMLASKNHPSTPFQRAVDRMCTYVHSYVPCRHCLIFPRVRPLFLTRLLLCQQIWVYGNSFKSCLVAVVVPNEAVLEKHAASAGIAGSYAELCANADIKKHILEQLSATGADGAGSICLKFPSLLSHCVAS